MNTRSRTGAWVIFVLGAFLLLQPPGPAAAEKTGVRLDAAGIESGGRLVNLRFQRADGVITLDDAELIEDDGPATGVPEGMDLKSRESNEEWIENLKRGVVIKKLLVLDDPAAFSGRLVFKGIEVKGNTHPLHISLNGVRIVRPPSAQAAPFARQYTDYSPNDRWYYIDLPVGALKKGENEILLWTESEPVSWRVLIALDKEFARGSLTRTRHPNRSLKSSDDGTTWTDSKLGPLGSVDGEYSVRLSLDRFVDQGEYLSPVMDAAEGSSLLKRAVRVGRVKVSADIETPEGTAADLSVRFGASPRPDDPSWTAWAPAGGDGVLPDGGNLRYVQWKAVLSTANPLLSPKLKGVEVSAEWEALSPAGGAGLAARAVRNGRAVRASYPFGYENLLHPELEKYRKNARLDRIVEGAGRSRAVAVRRSGCDHPDDIP